MQVGLTEGILLSICDKKAAAAPRKGLAPTGKIGSLCRHAAYLAKGRKHKATRNSWETGST